MADLADLAGMSPCNFARRFVERTGTTPAKFVERLRAERARQLIETTALPLVRVAERSGLRDEQSLRRALVKAFGRTPSALRQRATSEARAGWQDLSGSCPRGIGAFRPMQSARSTGVGTRRATIPKDCEAPR